MARQGTAACDPAKKSCHNLKNARNVHICPKMSMCHMWYSIISKIDKDAPSLHGSNPLRAFLMQRRRWQQCRGNLNSLVPTPDVQDCRTEGTVRNTASWWRDSTRSTAVIRQCIKSTAEHGRESVTAMCRRIPFVSGATSKAFSLQSRRYTTRCLSHREERTRGAI